MTSNVILQKQLCEFNSAFPFLFLCASSCFFFLFCVTLNDLLLIKVSFFYFKLILLCAVFFFCDICQRYLFIHCAQSFVWMEWLTIGTLVLLVMFQLCMFLWAFISIKRSFDLTFPFLMWSFFLLRSHRNINSFIRSILWSFERPAFYFVFCYIKTLLKS